MNGPEIKPGPPQSDARVPPVTDRRPDQKGTVLPQSDARRPGRFNEDNVGGNR